MREQRVIVITDTANYRKFGVNSFLRAAVAGANILMIIVDYHGNVIRVEQPATLTDDED